MKKYDPTPSAMRITNTPPISGHRFSDPDLATTVDTAGPDVTVVVPSRFCVEIFAAAPLVVAVVELFAALVPLAGVATATEVASAETGCTALPAAVSGNTADMAPEDCVGIADAD